MSDKQILEAYKHFTKADKENYVRNAGWHTLWHEDNWVPPNCANPDWNGHSLDQAFCEAVRSNGLKNFMQQ